MSGWTLQDRTVLITGGARGMGRITAKALASQGARLVIADWEGEQGERVCWEIRQAGGTAEFHYCNLAEQDSVRQFAATFRSRHRQLHVLINNAGITYPVRQETRDGLDMHFAACHLGHFQLTHLLLDRLRASAPARIVFVASEGHKACQGLDFDDIDNRALWRGRSVNHAAGFMAYARAKLCMLHTMRALHERLQGSGVTVNALSPGYFVNTGIHREMRGPFRWGAALVFALGSLLGPSRPQRAARTHIWLASSPAVGAQSGLYFQNCRPISPSPQVQDATERERLWQLSCDLTGVET